MTEKYIGEISKQQINKSEWATYCAATKLTNLTVARQLGNAMCHLCVHGVIAINISRKNDLV